MSQQINLQPHHINIIIILALFILRMTHVCIPSAATICTGVWIVVIETLCWVATTLVLVSAAITSPVLMTWVVLVAAVGLLVLVTIIVSSLMLVAFVVLIAVGLILIGFFVTFASILITLQCSTTVANPVHRLISSSGILPLLFILHSFVCGGSSGIGILFDGSWTS